MMLKKDPTGGAVPNLMTVRLGDDHTNGLNPRVHSPRSMVADNDYGVGQLVETISKSPIWKSCAIFIIEDDAQNGPDHVDAHRSTCYVISPWIKKGSVDHTFHNTASCLRTIELLLGLPPMCQYDATANPIMDWDTAPNNDAPFAAVMPSEQLAAEHNPNVGEARPASPETQKSQAPSPELQDLIRRSMAMDFTRADRAPADELNEIIWKSIKGLGSTPPPTPHGPSAATGRPKPRDDDDD
jgi:hypothetical protein